MWYFMIPNGRENGLNMQLVSFRPELREQGPVEGETKVEAKDGPWIVNFFGCGWWAEIGGW